MNNDFKNDDIRDLIVERDGYLEQVKELEQELQRKDNIINELKKWLEKTEIRTCLDCLCYSNVLDKIKELENDN